MKTSTFEDQYRLPTFGTKRDFTQITQNNQPTEIPTEIARKENLLIPIEIVPKKDSSEFIGEAGKTMKKEFLELKQEHQFCRETGVMIDQALSNDEKYIDFEFLVASEMKQRSDMSKYENIEFPLIKLGEYQIPEIVINHYKTLGSKLKTAISGIWTEINRVYITINNRLYLWNFNDPINGLISFDPMPDNIEAIHLMKIPEIPLDTFYLWIASDTEITLFYLQINEQKTEISPGGFSLQTDGVIVSKFHSLKSNNRLFYGGNDGHLNEILYNEYKSCFRLKNRIVKHDHSSNFVKSIFPSLFDPLANYTILDIISDETRNILYTFLRSNRPEINETRILVYDLGAYGDGLENICMITDTQITEKIGTLTSLNNSENIDQKPENQPKFEITQIFPISKTHSDKVQLLLIAKNGYRIYLSFTNSTNRLEPYIENMPYSDIKFTGDFEVSCIIGPPQVTPFSEDQPNLSIQKAFYSQEMKFLLMTNSNIMPFENVLENKLIYTGFNESALSGLKYEKNYTKTENFMTSSISKEKYTDVKNSVIIDIQEKKISENIDKTLKKILKPKFGHYQGCNKGMLNFNSLPIVSKYVYLPSTQFYILNSLSLSIFDFCRPIDSVYNIIEKSPVDLQRLHDFALICGYVETGSMLLHIICNPNDKFVHFTENNKRHKKLSIDQIVKNATKAFFQLIPEIPDFYRKTKFASENNLISPSDKVRSERVEALFVYLSRIIRPIWEKFIFHDSFNESQNIRELLISLNYEERSLIQGKLITLKLFVENTFRKFFKYSPNRFSQYFTGIAAHKPAMKNKRQPNSQNFGGDYDRMIDADKQSMDIFNGAINRILQGLEFLSIFDDPVILKDIFENLIEDDRKTLYGAVFKQLISKQIPENLQILLIYLFIDSRTVPLNMTIQPTMNADLIQLSKTLKAKIPLFYKDEHFEVYRAFVLLDRANYEEYDKLSYSQIIKEVEILLFKNLMYVPNKFVIPYLLYLGEFSLLVRLLIKSAEEYNIWGNQNITHKSECYQLFTLSLEEIYNEYLVRKSNPSENLLYISPNKTAEEILKIAENMIHEAILINQDSNLHFLIFQWLNQKQLTDQLVSIKSTYLDEYIASKTSCVSKANNNTKYMYHIERGQFKEAAQALYELAIKNNNELPKNERLMLEDRMDYLNIVLDTMNNIPPSNRDKLQIKEYIENTQFCKDSLIIQINMLRALNKRLNEYKNLDKSEIEEIKMSISDLENNLVPVQLLFDNYAKKFGLWEYALQLILHSVKGEKIDPVHLEEIRNIYANMIIGIYKRKSNEWPFNIREKLYELCSKYYFSDTPELFPLYEIIKIIEQLNSQTFSFDNLISSENSTYSLKKQTDKIEYWLIFFLHNEPLKLSYEDIYKKYWQLYLESSDSIILKEEFRIILLLFTIIARWIISIQKRNLFNSKEFDKCLAYFSDIFNISDVFF